MFFAFHLADASRGSSWSPLLLGIAAMQNTPIALCLPLHALYLLRERLRMGGPHTPLWPTLRRMIAPYAAATALIAASMLYWLHYFGVASVIEDTGLASLDFASMGRVSDLFFSPAVGAIWFFPSLFLFLPLRIRRGDMLLCALALVTVTAMAWLSTATRNLNAGQVGATRYTVWLLAPLWWLLFKGGGNAPRVSRLRIGLFLLALGVNVAAIVAFKHDRLARKDIRRAGGAWRGVPEVARLYAATHYHDDAEIFAETIRGSELGNRKYFRGVYLWNLTDHASLIVVARRGLTNSVLMEWTAPRPVAYRTAPAGTAAISFSNDLARLQLPPDACFAEHPYLGEYLLLWIDAAVDRPKFLVEQQSLDSRPAAKSPSATNSPAQSL